jgi:hypothetical protein
MSVKEDKVEVTTKPGPRTNEGLESPKLGAYTDYRIFLRDFYEFKRAQTKSSLRPYSYATFAASADIKSPNYLKLIIDGQRNLSREMAIKSSWRWWSSLKPPSRSSAIAI